MVDDKNYSFRFHSYVDNFPSRLLNDEHCNVQGMDMHCSRRIQSFGVYLLYTYASDEIPDFSLLPLPDKMADYALVPASALTSPVQGRYSHWRDTKRLQHRLLYLCAINQHTGTDWQSSEIPNEEKLTASIADC